VVQDLVLPVVNPSLAPTMGLVILASSHLFGEAHISATLFRIYGSDDMRNRFKTCTIWLPFLGLLLCVAGLFHPFVTAVMLKVYLLWVFQHFVGQAYGLCLLYCQKRHYTLSIFDKKLLLLMLNSAAAMAITAQLTSNNFSTENFLGQALPDWGFLPHSINTFCALLLQASVGALCVQICWKSLVGRQYFPLPALLMLLTVIATFTSNPSASLWLYLPAFFHATQYLAVTVSQYLKERQAAAENARDIWKQIAQPVGLKYYSNLLVIAVLLYVLLPTLLSFCGFPRELTFASVFAVVNLHHFLTDMTIWKMRDSKTRNSLV
jgi:hypothetical protein